MKKSTKYGNDFEVYINAVKLFDDFLNEDLPLLKQRQSYMRLASMQLWRLESICVNMVEGYKSKSYKEIKKFWGTSRSLTKTTKTGYIRLKNVLPGKTIQKRVTALKEIKAMIA